MPKQTFFNLSTDKQEKIIDRVSDIFIEKEYNDVSIREITSRAEISIGSFYQYFHDKDDLYIYLISRIEKKIYDKEMKEKEFFLVDRDILPIEDICTQKEIDLNYTWYRAPVEVMMKFYFGKDSKELNSNILDELIDLKNKDKLNDFLNIDFIFHIYSTSMFNIQMYFRDNNITDEKEKLRIKRNYYDKYFLKGILKD